MPVLVNVAFITLLERKILGYSQLRKGPNKVGIIGLPQPFNDAIKLFTKEKIIPSSSNFYVFILGPVLAIFFSLIIWLRIPLLKGFFSISLSFIFIYTIARINIYPLIASGWSSNRNYASIGALRGIAQTISYEVSFALIILFLVIIFFSLRLKNIIIFTNSLKFLIFLPLIIIWLIVRVAETNRTPFDFAEGESELVSGFNIEYGSVGFALIFIAEYARIYFISYLFSIVFFLNFSSYLFIILITLIIFFWVWVRTTFPRYRYDLLINIAWTTLLPTILFLLFYRVIIRI